MINERLSGIWGTIQVPYLMDDQVDEGLLDEQIQYLVSTPVAGLYSNGTAAEFYNQTESEFDRIQTLLADRASAAGKLFQIGVSHMSPIVSLERLRRSKFMKPLAFQVILPDWLPLTKTEQYSFLSRMAEAADPIPLVLYMPGHAKNKLSVAELHELALLLPALTGVKYGYVRPEDYGAARQLNQVLSLFIPGHHLATGIMEGFAAGSYSNMACINPFAACQWYDSMFTSSVEGLVIQGAIHRFFEEVISPFARQGYADPALDKLLAAAGGKIPGHPSLRWPHRSVDLQQIAQVRHIGKTMLPVFFE